MATFFGISDWGDLLGLFRLLKSEGHTVQLHVKHPEAKDVGRGLVDLAKFPAPPPGAIVIFDHAGAGTLGQQLRAKGHPVIGGNPLDKELDLDRTKGTAHFTAAGIKTPDTHTFTSMAQGRAFLATHKGQWFWKPNGNLSCSTTYNGKDAAQLARFLAWAETHIQGIKGFELQKKVDGTEVSVEGWFDGTRFVPPFNSTIEDKKFLAGDLGPRTGCQTNVVWPWETDTLPERTVARLEKTLKAAKYVGPIDSNLIVDADGTPYGLEWSPRLGFDAIQALCCLLDPVGDQLEAFARGSLKEWSLKPGLALTVRMSTPPFPAERDAITKKPRATPLPVHGLPLDPKLCDTPGRIFVDDVMLGKDGQPALAGRDGNVCCVGLRGDEMVPLRKALLKVVDGIDLPNRQYRRDLLPRFEEAVAHLKAHRYIREADVVNASRPKPNPGASSKAA